MTEHTEDTEDTEDTEGTAPIPSLTAVAHIPPGSADADYNLEEANGYVHGVAFSEKAAVLFALAPEMRDALSDLVECNREGHADELLEGDHRTEDCAFCAAVATLAKLGGNDA